MTASSPFRPLDVANNPFLGPVAAIPTPFEHDDRAKAVPANAAEGTYTYAMIPTSEALDTSEVDSMADALEVEGLRIAYERLDRPDQGARRVRQALTLAYASLRPVALLLGRDLMWEEAS